MNDETKSAEIVAAEGKGLQAPPPSGLSPMVQAIMSGQVSTEQMKEMLEIQKDFEQNEARKAYFAAKAEYKKNPADVVHDKENKQFDSGYSSRSNLVNTVNHAMSPYGLSAQWDLAQNQDSISVTCILSHSMGHSESVTLSAPPDKSGAKNPIQQIKSTITYLEIVTYEAVTGTASRAADLDDDGNAAGIERITEEQSKTIDAKLRENDLDRDKFLGWLRRVHKVEAIDQIAAPGFNDVMRTIDQTIKAKQHD